MAAKIVSEKKSTEKETEPKEPQNTTLKSSGEVTPTIQPEPVISTQPEPVISTAFPEVEDWRMNREWCLNQALDIVKSLKFEVKDVPAFLEEVYRKVVELANDARRGKNS